MRLIEAPEAPKDQLSNLIEQAKGCLSSSNMALTLVGAETLHNILGKMNVVNELGVLESFRGAVPPIKNLIAGGAWEPAENEIRLNRQLVNCLFGYTLYGEPGVEMLMQANIIPTLMTALTHDDKEVQDRTTILLFGMLHKGKKPEVIPALLESNFLNLVRDLLRTATSIKHS